MPYRIFPANLAAPFPSTHTVIRVWCNAVTPDPVPLRVTTFDCYFAARHSEDASNNSVAGLVIRDLLSSLIRGGPFASGTRQSLSCFQPHDSLLTKAYRV